MGIGEWKYNSCQAEIKMDGVNEVNVASVNDLEYSGSEGKSRWELRRPGCGFQTMNVGK